MADVYGVQVEDIIPDSFIATEAVCIVKMLDDDGDYRLAHVYSDGISAWEALGMARAAVIDLERQLARAMDEADGDDD